MRAWHRVAALLTLLLVGIAGSNAQANEYKTFFAPNRWAIVIGAGDYADLGALPSPPKDAESVASALQSEFGFDQDKVLLLSDLADSEQQRPTRQNILSTIETLSKNPSLKQGDLIFFYFSGHGLGTSGTDLLMPTDAKYDSFEKDGIPVRALMEKFTATGVKNIVFVADACRSGEKNPFGTEVIKLTREASISLLLGCEPGGRSYELRNGRGALSHALITLMRDKSLADDDTGALWMSHFAAEVKARVEELTADEKGVSNRQIPSVFCDKGQDVFLGAFVPFGVVGDADLERLANDSLSVDIQVRNLFAMAVKALDQGDARLCVRILTIIGGLNQHTAESLATLAAALDAGGDIERAEKAWAELRDKFPRSYFALLHRSLHSESKDDRLEAATDLFKMSPDVTTGTALIFAAIAEPAMAEEPLEALLDLVVDAFPEDSGPFIFFDGFRQMLLMEPAELARLYKTEFAAFPELEGVRRDYVEMLVYSGATKSGDPQAMRHVIDLILPGTPFPSHWELVERNLISRYGVNGDPGALAESLVKKARSGQRLWTAVTLWAGMAGEHLDPLREAAAKFPRDVKAETAVWVAQLYKDIPDTLVIPEKLKALGFEHPSEYAAVFREISIVLQDPWFGFSAAPDTWRRSMLATFVEHPQLENANWWTDLYIVAIHAGRSDLLRMLGEKAIANRVQLSEASLFVIIEALLEASRFDEAITLVQAEAKAGNVPGSITLQQLGAYAAIHFPVDRASTLWTNLKTIRPLPADDLTKSIDYYLSIREGESAAVPRLGESSERLAYKLVALGKHARGEATFEDFSIALSPELFSMSWSEAPTMQAALSLAEGEYRELIQLMALVWAEPAMATFQFPYVLSTSGSIDLAAEFGWKGSPMQNGLLKIEWSNGQAKVKLSDQEGKPLEFSGTISTTGYLDLTAEWQGSPATLRGRIIPAEDWNKLQGVARWHILNKKGEMGLLFVRPIEKS